MKPSRTFALVSQIAVLCALGLQPVAQAQSTTPDADFADGKALGNARKGETVANIKNGTARATDPNYTAAPPQAAYYGSAANLSAQTAVQNAACAANPDDASCAGAIAGTTVHPKQYLTNADPALAAAAVTNDPRAILGNIAATYSACASDTTLVTPATYTQSSCQIKTAAWSVNACTKTLVVAPKDKFNCSPGGVAAQVNFGWDYQKRDGPDLYRNGGVVRVYCTPTDTTELQIGAFGGDVSEHDYGSGPNFGPAPVPGLLPDLDKLTIPTEITTNRTLPRSGITILAGSKCTFEGACTFRMKRGNRSFMLSFSQPNFQTNAGDYWTDNCSAFEAQAVNAVVPPDGVEPPPGLVLPVASTSAAKQCTRTRSVCVDGPSTKVIDGIPVTRACWKYANTFDCTTLQASSTCNDPAYGKCTQAGPVVCLQNDAAGHCLSAQAPYSCKTADAVYGPAVNCGAATFCPGGSCYSTASAPDQDFAQSVTMLEAGREAGKSANPATLKVFVGYDNRCTHKLFGLINCCKGGNTSAASSFNNIAVAAKALSTVGEAAFSTYTYDALFTSDAPDMVVHGFEALFDTGFDSGLASMLAGDLSVADFMTSLVPGPWSLAMLAIQYSGLLTCPKDAQVTAMKKDANLCHAVGSFCSSKILGVCQETTQTYCCFPSRLAKIINEQGRVQLGQTWGDAKTPSCGGFTIAQLQSLNFAAMDLSEFYAEIAPTLPNVTALQNGALAKQTTCYYGAGKC